MPVTPPEPLVRTNYLSWPPGPYMAEADPDNPSYDPSLVIPAGGVPSNGNMATDEEQYIRPLERVHGMALHAPGVGWGMDIACTLNSPGVAIMAGIALDASGKHIYLAEGGNAEIGPDADIPGTPADLAPVTASGAMLPTVGFTGTYYVAVQWWETWDSAAYASDGVNQYNDTPWLQLITAGEYDPDIHVVLGRLVLDGSGNVTGVSYGDVGGLQRTNVSIPVQSVQLQRAANSGSTGAHSVSWGEVRAREGGGIEMITQNAGDQVNVTTPGGGTFSSMAIAASTAYFGEKSNPSIVLDTGEATLKVGAPGNYGDVYVYDANNHLSVSLIGDTGHVVVGGSTLNGEVRMLDSGENQTMTLDGSNGSAVVQNLTAFSNNTINVNTTFLRCHGTDFCLDGRSHQNNRALVDDNQLLVINYNGDYRNGVEINGAGLKVDGNTTVEGNLNVDGTIFDGNGTPLEGNPARKLAITGAMMVGSDFSGQVSSATTDIDLGSATQFSALIIPSYLQEYVDISYNAATAVEVLQVDGNGTPVIGTLGISGAGDPNLHVVAFSGFGQVITFRARGMDDSIIIFATGIVYFE